MQTNDLDFDLPADLIAQHPLDERTASRLLHYRRDNRSIAHRTFADLPAICRPGDLLVFNDARVTRARFTLRKKTGGMVEGLFLALADGNRWRVLLKNVGPWSTDSRYELLGDAKAVLVRIAARFEAGEFLIEPISDEPAYALLERIGRMPLPPYIRRDKVADARDAMDAERYQTVYASAGGSIAAPTAGLHFTTELLDTLDARGVERTEVTLNVGLGTFKPVTADTLEAHAMHRESYSIPQAAANAINRAKQEGRRVVAIGTTSARVLESAGVSEVRPVAYAETDICIFPPYRWKIVDALITNLHLPRSTLVALVMAMVGIDEQRRIYAEAIARRYRFFSYGDAMIIE